jgi:hypothetical protein
MKIPSKKSKGKRISIPAELYRHYEEIAEKTNRTISDVITDTVLNGTKA